MELVIIFFLFLLGAAISSFLTVIIDRIPSNESPWQGRSRCDECKHQLGLLDLVPILSFLLLKGRCRYCHKKLSWHYPLFEASLGLLFVAAFWWAPLNPVYVVGLLTVIASLFGIFIADFKYQIIPDEFVVSGCIGALLMLASPVTELAFIPTLLSAFGASLFFLSIYLITKARGMGFGDVKLAFLLGLLLGFPKIILGIYAAFLIGAVFASVLLFTKQKKWGQRIAFGPFLIIGTVVSFFYGPNILHWYVGWFS